MFFAKKLLRAILCHMSDAILPIFLLLGFFVALLIAHAVYIEWRLRAFLRGQNGANLEEIIRRMVNEHSHMLQTDTELTEAAGELRKLLSDAVRGISVVRFNALSGDTSGKQSFAAAILSERGDGVVFSSLHARENARMYAKPVNNFVSEFELTDEEKQAIVEARKRYAPVSKK
ncbi:MAG: DUF4446 family protein [Parcubacteria group bacterium]|nr:DUF4446 family protein [Parcubacteria group bacterium]